MHGFSITRSLCLSFVLMTFALGMQGAEPARVGDPVDTAWQNIKKGQNDEALKLLNRAINADDRNVRARYLRAQVFDSLHQYAKALGDYDAILALEPNGADVYQARGWTNFRQGNIKEAIVDFDQYLQRTPQQIPHHWQRGIAYYYAGRFEEGRKQFELHQTVNPQDVENAVWHYLCVAKLQGVAKARESFIRITSDSRVPMKEIHALFAGKGTEKEVFAAARVGDPGKLNDQLFYAHLYAGLYYEAQGDAKASLEHITKAARDFKAEHYMGDVARVHLKLRSGIAP